MNAEQRKRQLLLAGVEDAKENGLTNVSFETVAKRADVTHRLVRHYFNRMGDLWREIGLQDEGLRNEAVRAGIVFDAD